MKSTLGMNHHGLLALSASVREALGLQPDDVLAAVTTRHEMPPRRAADIPFDSYPPQPVGQRDAADTEQTRFLSKKMRPR